MHLEQQKNAAILHLKSFDLVRNFLKFLMSKLLIYLSQQKCEDIYLNTREMTMMTALNIHRLVIFFGEVKNPNRI